MSFNLEPAIWVGAAEAIIVLLVAFGIPISNEQKVAIIAAVSAILAIVGAFVVRSQVTPTAKVDKNVKPASADAT